jgi:hypothetical protein
MRLAIFAAIAAAAAGLAAYDKYDKATNFQAVDAHINAVSEQCYMEKVDRGALTKTTSTSDLLRCDVAERLTREHPHWQGYAIKHKIEIRFDYVSPVDRATHASSMTLAAFPKGRQLHAGDIFPVLASNTKADKTREL